MGISYVMSVQFSSVAQSCPTLRDPMNRSTPGLPVQERDIKLLTIIERGEARSQDLNPQSLAPFLVASESSPDTVLTQ